VLSRRTSRCHFAKKPYAWIHGILPSLILAGLNIEVMLVSTCERDSGFSVSEDLVPENRNSRSGFAKGFHEKTFENGA